MANVKIYVAMHRPDDHVLTIKDPIYIPIHCGKDVYIPEEDVTGYLPEFGDNTGDNISEKNQDYCELTAMYWIWKNDHESDIVGLNHYRRYFCESEDDRVTLMSKDTIEDLLLNKGYEYIINSCEFNFNEFEPDDKINSVYQDYKEMHDIRDFDNTLTALHILYPNIADKMEYMMKHNYPMAYCNMLISTKKCFDEYAKFLFSVLNYVETNYGVHGYRGLGYVAERLFRPWLLATKRKTIQGHELDWSKYSGYVW